MSKSRTVVPEHFETNTAHLPIINIGENVQSLVFYGSKNTDSALYENDVREEIDVQGRHKKNFLPKF